MNTDRELLEFAAKAAGIECEIVETLGVWIAIRRSKEFQPWQPSHDDGDALRLGVKLMEFEPYKSRGILSCICDDVVKTRRAIVRAAAEIGKTMP